MTVDRQTGEITASSERGHLLTLLDTCVLWCEKEREAKREKDILLGTNEKPGILRQWALSHPDDPLEDERNELVATYQATSPGFDIQSLLQQHPNVVLELARLGLLSLNFTAWRAHPKNFVEADVAKGYIMPGGEVLRVEARRRRQ